MISLFCQNDRQGCYLWETCSDILYNGILCVMGWSEHSQIKILHSCHEFRNQNSVLELDIFKFLDHVVGGYFFIFEAIEI